MGHAARTLGPITEARFAKAFADTALATLKAASKLIGVDPDTLSTLTDEGVVRAVRRGKLRSYTEHDLRAYLLDGHDAPARPRKPPPAHVSRAKVVPFSQRTGARR